MPHVGSNRPEVLGTRAQLVVVTSHLVDVAPHQMVPLARGELGPPNEVLDVVGPEAIQPTDLVDRYLTFVRQAIQGRPTEAVSTPDTCGTSQAAGRHVEVGSSSRFCVNDSRRSPSG